MPPPAPDRRTVALAAGLACVLEVSAEKPGNVTPTRSFEDLSFADLVSAGMAIAPVLASAGERGVGAVVLDAVRATRAVAAGNPNLGIILLLAPLARAALTAPSRGSLRGRVAAVLAALDERDAADAFAAIRLAQPGGLGEAPEHDVRGAATVGLREAMIAAADRDAIAAEYADGFATTFDVGAPRLRETLAAGVAPLDAIVDLHLTLLAHRPDTLIDRKSGPGSATAASAAAADALRRGSVRTGSGRQAIAELDRALRDPDHRGNPGATADLVTATLFVVALDGGLQPREGEER